ncbi:hypothetical protein J4573_17665 [Actinomadura barringtoniae]|uniref:Uncharacterized protein n=1 Tax=Actinomadura barringtoniae TaxID=1427535 RepID=A0A939PAF2_9ACTN|nr:hypothetical protein [Actinomadura barringtoniae]MBO2448935.1 hypothetical protein [Actinomadura barringtoniae]
MDGVMGAVDVTAMSEAVALMAATGAVSGLSESAALGVVERMRQRVRAVFGSDTRSVDVLEQAVREPSDEGRMRELTAALAWYAQRDEEFASDLAGWADEYMPAGSVVQNVRAGRDAYAAGRDMTVNQRPDMVE